MDIGALLNQAGGASAIARQLGVDESTVESGASALAPHVVNGIETQGLPGGATEAQAVDPQALSTNAADPAQSGGLGGMLGGLMGGGAGGALGGLLGGGIGNQILGHIFGSKDVSRDVATQASQQSGIDSSVLKKLLPIVAGAVAMHYMTHRNQGSGTSGANGGGGLLGSVLGGLGR